MSDFIREVNEEVRQERIRRFLDRYWLYLLGAVALVLAGVGAWRVNDYLSTQAAQTVGGRYLDALDMQREGKTADAITAMNGVAKDGTAGYRLLARFSIAADTGKTDPVAGAKLFDAIAADAAVDPAYQNLARLRAGVLLVDTASYPALKQRLEPLADANNGMRNSARELLAVAALKAGQTEEAGRWLDAIETDPAAQAALRRRAEAMLSLVRAGSGDATSEAAKPTLLPPPTGSSPPNGSSPPTGSSQTDSPAK